MSEPVTWTQIRSQFTEEDIEHMKKYTGGGLDLGDCASVQKWAQEVYARISVPSNGKGGMPPGEPWPQEWIDNFKSWMDQGSKCPPKAG
jgi:hypothetical protein